MPCLSFGCFVLVSATQVGGLDTRFLQRFNCNLLLWDILWDTIDDFVLVGCFFG